MVISFGELAIIMAAVGFLMILASVAKTSYAAALRSTGILLLVAGIILYVILLLF